MLMEFSDSNSSFKLDAGDHDVEDEKRKKKQALAQQRRQRAMEQMKKLQKNFIKEHAAMFEATNLNSSTCEELMDISGDAEPVPLNGFPICVGFKQTMNPVQCAKKRVNCNVTCILCQETQTVSFNGRAVVCAALVQK